MFITCPILTISMSLPSPGYVEAVVIPKGARNIRVEEVAEANNYLAVANDRGQYYLNGYWFIQWSGDYDAAGTVLHYTREGNREKFFAPGPLKEALHIMVGAVGGRVTRSLEKIYLVFVSCN